MILVCLGTFDIQFPRPLMAIEDLCKKGVLNDEIIVQNGHTEFISPFLKMIPFIDPFNLDKLYNKASIIITHAGTGSILKGVKMGKKVISIPRLKKYDECVDDHQLEIQNEFSKRGFIIPWNENDSLEAVLLNSENFVIKKYESNKDNVISFLKLYIDSI